MSNGRVSYPWAVVATDDRRWHPITVCVIAVVADPVKVLVELGPIVEIGTVVANVAAFIAIPVCLVRVGSSGAVVEERAHTIFIPIRAVVFWDVEVPRWSFARILALDERAGIAFVAEAILVLVELLGVRDGRAIVAAVANAVPVVVLADATASARAGVTEVPDAILVVVTLQRILAGGAVVIAVVDTVPIPVPAVRLIAPEDVVDDPTVRKRVQVSDFDTAAPHGYSTDGECQM